MISYPSIDKLLDRVDSRYSLAVLAAKRAHELEDGDIELLNHYESPRTIGKAFEEIADGKIEIDPDSILLEKDAEKIEEEKKEEN
ncbi:DNA-directed RNA polymerase subunit omega [Companilactobacillus sp.]|jgi:DNA-directed RNA polymerase subunit omega|uniref:DNA-directed RNA polymerase subunit omega n=1 Tax=Companilactobacillus sp. TaxID=2767905 RepID=UPI0025C5FCA5|nr:DNA-directed RNA polymerase subunit omega [Companilactobacillus sp.]MCH4008034.1 DNA-directed RNA polymerase subunit omega [Companilactobacillus sp.]MCH4051787.1 DNA-directed RNA polymerase subunit omega [Companilactobacillus sp.]MCH4075977.1 DNA-directed RNA polymerase subunit omega [Companilactobacillus sp.]MCH4124552.1 DNA-directed RNA polymerase subunit omega [Companilactobacillus sp.]MCH4132485.1 DNA-directed RNA polymerase subunit omega [Companilactobacillus sp.]